MAHGTGTVKYQRKEADTCQWAAYRDRQSSGAGRLDYCLDPGRAAGHHEYKIQTDRVTPVQSIKYCRYLHCPMRLAKNGSYYLKLWECQCWIFSAGFLRGREKIFIGWSVSCCLPEAVSLWFPGSCCCCCFSWWYFLTQLFKMFMCTSFVQGTNISLKNISMRQETWSLAAYISAKLLWNCMGARKDTSLAQGPLPSELKACHKQ